MAIIKRSELRGILILAFVILVIGGLLAVASGKLETWFGITVGPRLYDRIVYVSGNELYTASADGSGVKQLTTGGLVLAEPSVSPNGSRVAFVGRAQNGSQILMIRGGGGEPAVVTSTTGGKRLPRFSPDGSRLAFISGGTVYVGNQEGSDLHPILPTAQQSRETILRRDPMPAYSYYAWCPDGSGVAAVWQNGPHGEALMLLPKLNGDVKSLGMPSERTTIGGLSWASEGQLLASTADIGGRGIAAVADVGAKDVRALANSPNQSFGSIALSPDGSTAVFVVRAHGKGTDGIASVDTQSGRGGLLAAGRYDKLSFSPDGEKILATRLGSEGERDVVVIDAATGDVTAITNDGRSFDAVWTPARPK